MTNTTTPSAGDSGLNLDHLEALAPCPFCGGKARIESSAMWIDLICDHDKACVLDGESAEMSYHQNTSGAQEQMVAKWNRRAAPVSAPTEDQWISRMQYDAEIDEWAIERSNLEAEIAKLKDQPAPTGSGQWVRCTPDLINAGVSCSHTPRRDGDGTYSHDHWIAHQPAPTDDYKRGYADGLKWCDENWDAPANIERLQPAPTDAPEQDNG